MLHGLATLLLLLRKAEQMVMYTFLTSPFTCQAITWPFAQSAIVSFYVYNQLTESAEKFGIGLLLSTLLN